MMFDKVKAIIVDVLNVDEEKITLESHLQDDLGADSLDAVDLIMSIEDELNITMPDEDVQNFRTVKDIIAFLEKL